MYENIIKTFPLGLQLVGSGLSVGKPNVPVNIVLCAVPWPLSPGASVGEKRTETLLLLLPPFTDCLINVVSQSVPAFYARNITVLMNDAICAHAQRIVLQRIQGRGGVRVGEA